MPIKILMPALSPTMTEGKLARWLKKEGDKVSSGQVLAEIETDKATMEVEAVDEGTLGKIVVPADTDNVPVNALIAVLLEEGEDAAVLDDYIKKQTEQAQASQTPSAKGQGATASPSRVSGADRPVRNMARGSRVFASPLAKRIAEQNNINLSQVQGTGPNGRVVAEDVEAALRGRQGSAPQKAGPNAKELADLLGMEYEAIPNNPIRKVVAQRLTESKQTVPHFYLTVDCEIDALLNSRKALNEKLGTKISVNDMVIKAVALALKQVPAANSSWTDEAVLQYKHADVSVAVATPTGLITPIVKKAEDKDLKTISEQMKDLATRARDNKLKPEEFQGGTFTVSNLGMFGIKDFQAIINPPQGCILAVGAGEQRVIVKDGQMVIATIMSCTLSVDHRAVDGAVGAEYISAFKKLIQEPESWVK